MRLPERMKPHRKKESNPESNQFLLLDLFEELSAVK